MKKCEICQFNCDLVPEREPFHDKYWICEKCDSTYCFEIKEIKTPIDQE